MFGWKQIKLEKKNKKKIVRYPISHCCCHRYTKYISQISREIGHLPVNYSFGSYFTSAATDSPYFRSAVRWWWCIVWIFIFKLEFNAISASLPIVYLALKYPKFNKNTITQAYLKKLLAFWCNTIHVLLLIIYHLESRIRSTSRAIARKLKIIERFSVFIFKIAKCSIE